MIHQIFLSYFCITTVLLAALFDNVTCGERKVAENNCQCGVQLVKGPKGNQEVIDTWTVFIQATYNASNIRRCAGTVIASNVIGASLKCLLPQTPSALGQGNSTIDISQITVTELANGQGETFPVLQILRKSFRSRIVGIIVDYNFTDKNNSRKPVCIPEECEFTTLSFLSLNASYVSTTGDAYRNLQVRKAEQCDTAGVLGKRIHNLLCVSIPGANVKAEEGQPVYVYVSKNPYGPESYAYLAGMSTLVLEDGLRTNVYFTHINSFSSVVDFITNTSSTEWCSQPWPWTKSPEKVKRDESLDCECGILRPQSGAQQGRVVGGVEATPYEFPWMLLLYGVDDAEHIFSCGASIINDRVVLTASHCIANLTIQTNKSLGYDVVNSERKFVLAANVHRKDLEDESLVAIGPTKFVVHPGYIDSVRRGIVEHDIALFIMDQPFNFTAKDGKGAAIHRPVCLPKYNEKIEYIGKKIIAAGWGRIHYSAANTSSADFLQKINLTAMPVEACNEKQSQKYKDTVGKTTFCVSTDWTHTVNRGDSGGPFIVDNGGGKYYQVGAVTFDGSITDENKQRIGGTAHAADLQELMPFVDYYSEKYNAKYCKQ